MWFVYAIIYNINHNIQRSRISLLEFYLIGAKPLHVIQYTLTFVRDNKKLKNQAIAFETTYILDALVNLSMIELIEQEGEDYVNNLIIGLKSLVHETITIKE